jgi:hypothetical protein
MVERRLNDPASMAGASVEELMALRPEGWLTRPMPNGRGGFRWLAPGKLPGQDGFTGYFTEKTHALRLDGVTATPALHILNHSAEFHPLSDIATDANGKNTDAARRRSSIAGCMRETRTLLHRKLITVWEDDLIGPELRELPSGEAEIVLANPTNWWTDEENFGEYQRQAIYVLAITDAGIGALRTAVREFNRGAGGLT